MGKTNNSRSSAQKASRGFTLIEMIVAVALFAVVMLVSVGALLALVGANRKAQALQSVMNNLNIALDGMVRSIRMGSNYSCDGGNCDPGKELTFKPFCDENCDSSDRWLYWQDKDENGVGRLYRSTTGNKGNRIPVTAPEIDINSLEYYVVGTLRSDPVQPKVVIVIEGTASANQKKTETTFSIQATAVQRILDI